MAARTRYFVQPNKDRGGWDVKKQGGDRASAHFDTKQEAVEAGRGLARGADPAQLIIKKLDGKIQTEHTYGNDPKRYRG